MGAIAGLTSPALPGWGRGQQSWGAVTPETRLAALLTVRLQTPSRVSRVSAPRWDTRTCSHCLLFGQNPNRQGGASSARRAGRTELHGLQHPVENAQAS